MVFSRRL